MVNYNEEFDNEGLQSISDDYQEEQFGRVLFNNGNMVPLGVTFVQETTVFREFGPLAGSTVKVNYEAAPKIGNFLTRQTVDVDARKYFRLGGSGLLALRAKGFHSWGESPSFMYFGGNSELRGYDYLSFVGQDAFFLNAELRFPLIEAMATPIGILGGIRGTVFVNLGGASWENQGFNAWTSTSSIERPIIDTQIIGNEIVPIYGLPREIDGFRLVDSRGSYGISLQTFALGFPLHFDWSWKTLFNEDWEDVVFSLQGGSSEFRKPKFSVWIGYDF